MITNNSRVRISKYINQLLYTSILYNRSSFKLNLSVTTPTFLQYDFRRSPTVLTNMYTHTSFLR